MLKAMMQTNSRVRMWKANTILGRDNRECEVRERMNNVGGQSTKNKGMVP